MKTTFGTIMLVIAFALISLNTKAETEERKFPVFTEISLRIPAKLYIEQGNVQKVTINASSSVLEEIITEIKGRSLIIRFPTKNIFRGSYDPGKIIIHITMPEVSALNVAGSGDIIGTGDISSLILDLNVSGSGNIDLSKLNAERLKAHIAGSGNIILSGKKAAAEFTGNIAGSGNIKAENFEAQDVKANIAGSGNCAIVSNGNIKVTIAGSGNFYYGGNPNVDSTIAGSGRVKEIK